MVLKDATQSGLSFSTAPTPKYNHPPITFKEFQKKKEKERATHFRPSKKAKREGDGNLQEKVTLNAGIMVYDGSLKKQRGKTLPVSVKKCCDKSELLRACVEKHKAHSSDIIIPTMTYELLYPDGAKVDKLKEEDTDFILYKYRRECGKPYHRITFFIATAIDVAQTVLRDALIDDTDSSDEDKSLYVSAFENSHDKDAEGAHNKPSTSSNVNMMSGLQSSSESSTILPSSQTQYGTFSKPNSLLSDTRKLLDMFPNVSHQEASQVLAQTNFELERAVTFLLNQQEKPSSSSKVYASFDFCNSIADDAEFFEEPQESHLPQELQMPMQEPTANIDSIADAVMELSKKFFVRESYLRIKVRRSQVWTDTKFKIQKCKINDFKQKLKIQFVGEPAVDEGGPRNEYFSLLHKELAESSLFTGENGTKCFSNNIIALQQKEYFMYGILCSMAILQGSASPAYFAPSVADYIVYGDLDKVSPQVAEIPDIKVKAKMQALNDMQDMDEFKNAASFESGFRFKAGFNKPIVRFEDKQSLERCVALHYTLLFSLPELEQFIDGLKVSGLLEIIRNSPLLGRKLFTHSNDAALTAESVDELFDNKFSQAGSNKLAAEEAVSMNFTKFLEDTEAGEVCVPLLDTADGMILSLGDVLQFITGSNQIPAIGFTEQPSIVFVHGDAKRKPHVSTCTNTLYLPIPEDLSYEAFKENFGNCIIMSPGFGTV